jgi:membrane-associated phospholipid phosphatase
VNASPPNPATAQRKPTNRLFAAYLLVAAPALLFPHRPPNWIWLLATHLVAAAALVGLGPFRTIGNSLRSRWPRTYDFIADWYLLILIPALYTELATLNLAVWNGHYFDPLILGWENAIFGQPSRDLAIRFPWLPLSEILHSAYLSYYLIIYVPFIVLYAVHRNHDHRANVFAVMLTFFVHYLFFIYFPVQGPRYLFPAPEGRIAEGTVFKFTHRLLEAGSSRGAAFPSSHVGVSIAQAIVTFRLLPRLAPAVAIAAVALAIGAVYGGFHYAIDASTGFLLGSGLAIAAPRIRQWFARQSQ